MHPLLSHEEISALMSDAKEEKQESISELNSNINQNDYILKKDFYSDKDPVAKFKIPLNKICEVKNQDRIVAYGILVVVDGKLVVQIVHMVD